MAYKDTSTTAAVGALTTETLDLPIGVDLVVLEDSHLDLLPLVLDLLRGLYGTMYQQHIVIYNYQKPYVVSLLLTLLRTTTQTEDKMESRLLLNVIVVQRTAIFELLPGEDQALLVGRDTAYMSASIVSSNIVQLRTLPSPGSLF